MTQIPGIGHNNPPPDPPPMHVDPAEAKAAAVLAEGLAADFSVSKAAVAARTYLQEAVAATQRSHKKTRKTLGKLYQIYVATIVDRAEAEALKAACFREKIPLRTTDLAIAVVRFHGKTNDTGTINRYANVL